MTDEYVDEPFDLLDLCMLYVDLVMNTKLDDLEVRSQIRSQFDSIGAIVDAYQGNYEEITSKLLDPSKRLNMWDRFLLVEIINGEIKKAKNRPAHPLLPRLMYTLSEILRFDHGYTDEAARVARIKELTGRGQSGIRDLIKRSPSRCLGFEMGYQELSDEQKTLLLNRLIHWFGKAGITLKPF